MKNKVCKLCGKSISHLHANAKFCSIICYRLFISAKAKAERKLRMVYKTCKECGNVFETRNASRLYCSYGCKRIYKVRTTKLRLRKRGTPPDIQQKTCPVCGTAFESKRAHQLYCSKSCCQYTQEQRRIDKKRKTKRKPFMSPQMIAKRAKVVRSKRTETQRLNHDHLCPEMPIIPEVSVLSQAERVRIHLRDGNVYGVLKIASAWPKLGDIRETVEMAWTAYQDRSTPDADQLIQDGIEALKTRLLR